jgi:hypothetical protein
MPALQRMAQKSWVQETSVEINPGRNVKPGLEQEVTLANGSHSMSDAT